MRTLGTGVSIPKAYEEIRGPVVRVQYLRKWDYDGGEYYRRLVTFAGYIAKTGKGEAGDHAEHFGKDGEPVDVEAFLAEAWRAPINFEVMLSPRRDAAAHLPMQEYVQVWMQQVEADLRGPLRWIASVHYDEGSHVHAHILLIGYAQGVGPFRIASPYIMHGMRARAAEIQAWYLGDA